MDYNSTDEEIVEGFKSWWKSNGKMVFASFLVIAVGLASYKYWNFNQDNHAEDAAGNFESALQLLSRGETKKAKELTKKINNTYSELPYAQLAGLLEARIYASEGNYEEAEKILKNILARKSILGLDEVAAARLVRIYLAQKNIKKAKIILEKPRRNIWTKDAFLELRGDLAVAERKDTEAKEFYEKALIQADRLGYPTSNLILKKNNISVRRAIFE